MDFHEPEKNKVFLRVKKLINKEYQDFFDKNGYRVFRNWLYNSWNEFIAIPKEDLENTITKDCMPFIDNECEDDDMWAGRISFPEELCSRMGRVIGYSPGIEELLGDYILCILDTFPKEIKKEWLEKNNFDAKAVEDYKNLSDSPLVKYAQELLRC